MPTAPVDDQGTEIFFTDSGVPSESKNYTTLVIFHGAAFTGNTFRKLIPDAFANNVRLIILNRREYSGSSQYTDAEIDDLLAGRKCFMERLGLQVANFLLWFVQTHNIPRVSSDRKSGGLAVMGWSLGNTTSLAFIGQPDVIPKELYQKLTPYMKDVILFDPPDMTFEYHETIKPKLWDPKTFNSQISGYYICTYDPNASPDTNPRPNKSILHPDKPPSTDNMTEEELASILEMPPCIRSDFPILGRSPPIRPVIREQWRKAVFDKALARDIFPELQVVFMAAEMTALACVWGKLVTEKRYMEAVEQGRRARPIRFITMKGANHFVHWDNPGAFWEAIKNAMNQ